MAAAGGAALALGDGLAVVAAQVLDEVVVAGEAVVALAGAAGLGAVDKPLLVRRRVVALHVGLAREGAVGLAARVGAVGVRAVLRFSRFSGGGG